MHELVGRDAILGDQRVVTLARQARVGGGPAAAVVTPRGGGEDLGHEGVVDEDVASLGVKLGLPLRGFLPRGRRRPLEGFAAGRQGPATLAQGPSEAAAESSRIDDESVPWTERRLPLRLIRPFSADMQMP